MAKFKLVRPTTGSFAKITTIEGKRSASTPKVKRAVVDRKTPQSRVGKSRYAN